MSLLGLFLFLVELVVLIGWLLNRLDTRHKSRRKRQYSTDSLSKWTR